MDEEYGTTDESELVPEPELPTGPQPGVPIPGKLRHGMKITLNGEFFKVYRPGKNITLKYMGKK